MKKIFLLIGIFLIFIISCSDTNTSYEVEMDAEEINWPFESIDNGKFTVLFKNSTQPKFQMSLGYLGVEIIPNKDQKDFCPIIESVNSGTVPEGVTIFTQINVINEQNVENKNDHPNFVSYSLPKGSYIIFTDKFDKCNNDSYVTFDVNTMDAFNYLDDIKE